MQDPFTFPHLEDTSSAEFTDGSENLANEDDKKPSKPSRQLSMENQADLGYGDGAPDVANKYGYENGTRSAVKRYQYDASRQPRRSSVKGSSGRRGRRESIGSTGGKSIEVRVRGERFPVVRRRSIDFARAVRVKEVTPVVKLNNNEEELWLQGEDFKQMKLERKKLVKSALRGNPSTDMRGLEKYMDKSIRQAKQVAWDTVLIEQDEQELAGEFSPDKLAEVYKHYTRESPAKAATKAQEDHSQIQDYVNTPRTRKLMMRRLSC